MIEAARRGCIAMALVAAILAGCGTTAPTKHYVLEPLPAAMELPGLTQLRIGVGPVEIPGYLDRPQWVSRGADGELLVTEFHRWAEPLPESLGRALREGLAQRLGTQRLLVFPWPRGAAVDYQVGLQVLRFEPQSDGAVVLEAVWTLSRSSGALSGIEVERRRAAYRETLESASASARAAAQNRAVAALCADLASAIRLDAAKR